MNRLPTEFPEGPKYYMHRFCHMFCSEESFEIMSVLDSMHSSTLNRQEHMIHRLKELNYNQDLLLIKQANIFLAKGMTRQAFDALCKISLLAKSPAILLNLGLILLEMGVHAKARHFLSRALDLLQEIPALAFEMADKSSRIRFGDSHMCPQRNISAQRSATLKTMYNFIKELLDIFPAKPGTELRKLAFSDTLAHNLFPFDLNTTGRYPAMPDHLSANPHGLHDASCY